MSSFTSPSPSVIELQGHRESIVFVLWIDSKKLLATASEDKSIRLWDIVTRKVVKCFCRCFDADIDAMYYFPTFSNALLVSSGEKLSSLDLANNVLIDSTPLSVFSCPSEISSLALTLPADRVSIGDDEGNIRFYSVHSEDGIQFSDLNIVLEGAHKSIVSNLLHYERGGRMFMLSSSYDCSCVLWTVDEGVFEVKALARVDFAHLGEVQGQMFNPPFVNMVIEMDEDFLLVALGDGSVRVIRKQDLLVMTSYEFHNHQTIALQRMRESYFSVGIEGTIQGFNCKKVSKKDKGRIKTKVELVPLRSFRHDQKINSSTAVVIDDETRYVAIADVGNILSLYRFAF